MSKGKKYLDSITNNLNYLNFNSPEIIDLDLLYSQEENLKSLSIEAHKHDGIGKIPDENGILKAVSYFIQHRDSIVGEFPKAMLRNLSFGFRTSFHGNRTILNRQNLCKEALVVLDHQWKDRYLIGLYFTLLESWGQNRDGFDALQKFVVTKLRRYKGENRRIKLLKENVEFIKGDQGPQTLVKFLRKNMSKPLREVPTLLGLKESEWPFSYFSDFLIKYVFSIPDLSLTFLTELQEILKLHSNDTANKVVISRIIQTIDEQMLGEELKNEIKEIAIKEIGDPDRNDLWSTPQSIGAHQKSLIRSSQQILIRWITRRFIEVFFKKCINEPRRKRFWLKVADHVDDFWVAGSEYTKNYKLRGEKGIEGLLDSRFNTVGSNTDVSALFLRINNHLIIEFSDQSFACYAYKTNNPIAPGKGDYIHSFNQLRDGSMPKAAYHSGAYIRESYDEGRLIHSGARGEAGAWENIFKKWFSEHVGIDVRL